MKNYLIITVIAVLVCGCAKTAQSNSGEATLVEMNRAYAAMSMNGDRPTNIDELMKFPSLRGKTPFKPPAGTILALDPKAERVVFVGKDTINTND